MFEGAGEATSNQSNVELPHSSPVFYLGASSTPVNHSVLLLISSKRFDEVVVYRVGILVLINERLEALQDIL